MQDYPHVQQVWIQTMLRGKGWIVPNYGAPPAEEKTEMLRVVGAYMHILLPSHAHNSLMKMFI